MNERHSRRGAWCRLVALLRPSDSYINNNGCDYVSARRIINGQDKSPEIAAMATQLEADLRGALLD